MIVGFRIKLLTAFIALLLFALGITVYAVLYATDRSLKENASRQLQIAERVLQSLLDENSRQLTDRTQLLAEDFGFKQAIATRESGTISSVLANHGERVNADMIVLLSTDGHIIVSSHSIDGVTRRLSSQIESTGTGFSMLMLAEGQPYQLVMVPVNAPNLVAWVGLGFVLDTNLLQSFKQITRMDISLIYANEKQSVTSFISTLPESLHPRLTKQAGFSADVHQFKHGLLAANWLSEERRLLENDDHLTAMLSIDFQRMLAAYQPLRWHMMIVAVVALLLSIIATVVLAGHITRPIDLLVKVAKRIADGDYHTRLSMKSDNEFGVLGTALDNMQNAIREREQRINYQAQHDLLTELPNRQTIASVIKKRLLDKEAVHSFGLAILSIANLQSLTDVYGAEISDKLLKLIAERIKNMLSKGDQVARFAENQFLISFEGLECSGIFVLSEKILALFGQRFCFDGIRIHVDVQIGFAICPEHGDQYDDLLRRAGIALSLCRGGSEVCKIYELGQDERHLRQLRISSRLQDTVKGDGFELHYQPLLNLKTQSICKVEALIRWTDAELGRMFPDEFIPLAESTGDITLITEWVLKAVIKQLLHWKQYDVPLAISINLSARDILNRSLINKIIHDMNSSGLEARWLSIELTETAMVDDPQHAVENMVILSEVGFDLSIDDFGTGFSSLAQLKEMPVNHLKVDKSFVLDLDHNEEDQQIVRSIIDMAHHLRLSVVAEGVESQVSMDLLQDMGCDLIQGYYLARPMPVDELDGWLQEFSERKLNVISA